MKSPGLAVLMVVALSGAVPGAAAAEDEWVPVPYEPVTAPAGTRCAFEVRVEPISQDVKKRVLETYPDGSVKLEEYTGPLVDRITNLDTGRAVEANASAHAFVAYHPDGVVTWDWNGPLLVGFGDQGNRAKGLYLLTGRYTADFAADGGRWIRAADGTERDLCAEVS